MENRSFLELFLGSLWINFTMNLILSIVLLLWKRDWFIRTVSEIYGNLMGVNGSENRESVLKEISISFQITIGIVLISALFLKK